MNRRSGGVNKKIWVTFGVIICLFVISWFYFNRNDIQQVSFYNQMDFSTVNNSDSWEAFSRDLGLIEHSSKIENYKLIMDTNNNIHSLRFDVIDKVNGEFEIYHYKNCYSCELEEENQVQIHMNTADKWIQFDELINADDFFKKMDVLNQENFFESRKFEYHLIVSSGRYENIALIGDYFVLEDERLEKIDKTEEDNYQGMNVRVMGNHLPSNFSSSSETDTVFISHFKKGRN